MAPSRGLSAAFKAFGGQRTSYFRSYSNFTRSATETSNNTQVYVSRSHDPYVNLSIEHFLLQKTPPESTILFLYTNRPSIVIGRNQNPWLEVNLGLLSASRRSPGHENIGDIDLVRRRSGGGTVFHDEGNVNYSVICPTVVFDRDRHAQMVVRALRSLGVERAKVNERHDIVLERENNTSTSQHDSAEDARPLKISGSAYKLTRLRSLHHGTCLLSSPNIQSISQYLRSPAKPYIKARGVDSVSSPVANVNVSNDDFERAVVREFGEMYGAGNPVIVTGEEGNAPEILKGLAELRVSVSMPGYIVLSLIESVPRLDISADPSVHFFDSYDGRRP
jgi:lipoate-protein ligase A